MIGFLAYLAALAVLGFAMALWSSRLLAGLLVDRRNTAAAGAVIVTLAAAWLFDRYAAPLIVTRATGPEMGGLAWLLTLVKYGMALFAVLLPAMIYGIHRGLPRKKGVR